MHTKTSNSSSPSKTVDPVSLKRNKQTHNNMTDNDVNMSVDVSVDSDCFLRIVKTSSHPVVLSKINRLRRKDTDSKLYRELMYEIGTFLAYEATSDLNLTDPKTVQGVSGAFSYQDLKERIAIAPVLRSGLGLVDSMLTSTPTATIVHLGLFKEKTTLQPIEYYSRLPKDNAFDICYILDPVIATGGTTAAAIDMIKDWGVKNVRIVCVNASKSGLKYIHQIHPDVKIYCGLIDEVVGAHGEIIPAVGDAGDRLFNSVN